MGGALGVGMMAGLDPVFFTIKRAYYATLRLTRRALRAMGLTAARFDVLDALYRLGTGCAHYQSDLRRGLGVARATISEMMRALETIGLVSRRRVGREVIVALTAEGRRRVRRAYYGLVLVGHVGFALDGALAPGERRWPDARRCASARRHIEALCMRIRLGFGDQAELDRLTECGAWVRRDLDRARRARAREEQRRRELDGALALAAPSA